MNKDCLIVVSHLAFHLYLLWLCTHLSYSSVSRLLASACFNADHQEVESLEEYIVLQAAGFGFRLETILGPNDTSVQEPASRKNDDVLNDILLHEMQCFGLSEDLVALLGLSNSLGRDTVMHGTTYSTRERLLGSLLRCILECSNAELCFLLEPAVAERIVS